MKASSIPSPRRLPGAAWILVVVLLSCLAAPSAARAQEVTSTGVQCGNEEISFETLNLPTEGANRARLRQLARLYAYAGEALAACDTQEDEAPPDTATKNKAQKGKPKKGKAKEEAPKSDATTCALPTCEAVPCPPEPNATAAKKTEGNGTTSTAPKSPPLNCYTVLRPPPPDAFPGCQFVRNWVKARSEQGAWPTGPDSNTARMRLRALDGQLIRQAARVLAHKACHDLGDKVSSECVDLVTQEATFRGENLCDQADTPARPQATGNQKKKPEPSDADQDLAEKAKVAAYYRTSGKAGCASSKTAAKDLNELIAWAVDKIAYERPTPRPPKDEAVPNCSTGKIDPAAPGATCAKKAVAYAEMYALHDAYVAVASEYNALVNNEKDCNGATYYVTPTGTLVHQHPGTAPTICIDTSTFALDRPFDVQVSVYGGTFGKQDRLEVPVKSVQVWPGEKVPLGLKDLHEDAVSVVRITIRGYPRGVSLRALALHGANKMTLPYETSDLRDLAQKVRQASAAAANAAALADALNALATDLVRDHAYKTRLTALDRAIAAAEKAPKDSKNLTKARDAAKTVRDAISAFLEARGQQPANGVGNGRQAITESEKLLGTVPSLDKQADLDAVKKNKDALLGYVQQVHSAADDATAHLPKADDSATTLTRTLNRLCRISKELIPVVDEDVLTGKLDEGTYVIDYDYEAGFQRAPTNKSLKDTDRVYLRVRRVRPGASVAVNISDKGVVQHAVSLVGLPGDWATGSSAGNNNGSTNQGGGGGSAAQGSAPVLPDQGSAGARSGMDDLDPDQVVVQPSSTQILVLPGLEGAHRHDVTVCAITDPNQSCPGDGSTKARVIARVTLVVHSERYLGVRAGLGASVVGGALRSLVAVPGSSTLSYVRRADVTPEVAVPLLLTAYFKPRDAIDFPSGVNGGVTIGTDVVSSFQAKPKLYAGFLLDCSGLGINLAYTLEGISSVDWREGMYVPTTATPPTTMRFYHGGLIALTTDLDIFQTVFSKYILNSAGTPALGTAAGK